MALISCPECDRQVSDRASACPGCGHPIAPNGHETRRPGTSGLDAAWEWLRSHGPGTWRRPRPDRRTVLVTLFPALRLFWKKNPAGPAEGFANATPPPDLEADDVGPFDEPCEEFGTRKPRHIWAWALYVVLGLVLVGVIAPFAGPSAVLLYLLGAIPFDMWLESRERQMLASSPDRPLDEVGPRPPRRLRAWVLYLVLTAGLPLIFTPGANGDIVLIFMILGTIPFKLWLNWRERRMRTSVLDRLGLPASLSLRTALGCFAGGVELLFLLSRRGENTVGEKVSNFFFDFAAPWMFGSFGSRIPTVMLGSLFAAVGFILSVTPVIRGGTTRAKVCLIALLLMSLFTVWIASSEVNSLESAAGAVAETAIKQRFIKSPIDAIVSALWVFGFLWVYRDLDREKARR